MTYNEAETRFHLIDPILREKGYGGRWKRRLETPAPVISARLLAQTLDSV